MYIFETHKWRISLSTCSVEVDKAVLHTDKLNLHMQFSFVCSVIHIVDISEVIVIQTRFYYIIFRNRTEEHISLITRATNCVVKWL